MKTSVRWDGSAGELTFTHTPAADGGPHSFAATLDGKPVGKLLVASENDRNGLPSGAIANINVNPEHRKLGIGRAMVEYAQSQGVFPRHNPYMMTSDGAGFARATPGFGFISRGARMRPVAKQKSYTCKFCKQPATKGVLWAEGMAIIPACDKHLAKAKGAVTGPDGKPDPSEICGIRDLTRKSALDESGKIQFSLDNDGQYHRVRAIRDGQLVGNLFLNMRYDPVKQLDNVPGEIRDMWVRKPDRKHGIA